MLERIAMSPGHAVGYQVYDELRADEIERIYQTLSHIRDEYGQFRLYLDMQSLPDVEPQALGKDLDRLPEFLPHIERLALVGDRRWQAWIAHISQWLTTGEARVFAPSEAIRAQRWIRYPSYSKTPNTEVQ